MLKPNQNICGVVTSEKIFENSSSVFWRGEREEDRKPVILKMLKSEYPSIEDVARFQREFEITRQLKIEGVVHVYDFQKYQNTALMILEDFGGISLRKLYSGKPHSLKEFLSLSIKVAKILGNVHKQNVVHRDINPRNIVYNPETSHVRLIDFGIASLLTRENATIKTSQVLEGSLKYISPEQTGRMNRFVDYRTDYYSLGVTYYELLTGVPPFQSNDPMELVHCHIAKTPIPPHELNQEIPEALSSIIFKLLAKTAEERYQSAHGLVYDLKRCLDQLESKGEISPFPLGEQDISEKFHIPEKLYGREKETEKLLQVFEAVGQGKSDMMLVTGYSGIGKSALVQEVHKPIVAQKGYFVAGKFDQFRRDVPYLALIQAFSELLRRVLTESESRIETWREKLQTALGTVGQVLVEVLPELELIIGPQPPVPELGASENQNRFKFTFQKFVEVFAKKSHPLAVFLDDLQWADYSSLVLLKNIITDLRIESLLVIGAYRDNEITPGHPLPTMLDEVRKIKGQINIIHLGPLDPGEIARLLCDTLRYEKEEVRSLAELCGQKTGGNPFFLNQFLHTLHVDGLFQFDQKKGRFSWDIRAIGKSDFTDNVLELMTRKLQRLREETREVLRLAACVGSRFDLKTLSVVYARPPQATYQDLFEALKEGLVVPEDEEYKYMDSGAEDANPRFRFLHDRVQQAAYFLIDDEYKKEVHLKIGYLLLEKVPEEERAERIFDIVGPLNAGLELITDENKKEELARLNLLAGRRAKSSAAYGPALQYLKAGMGLLPKDCWGDLYDLTLSLYEEAAEAAFLSQEFELAESFIVETLAQARRLEDKFKAYETRIQAHIARNKNFEAIQAGLELMRLLGISFPANPATFHILLGFARTKLALVGKNIEDLAALPEMTDPKQLEAVKILMRIAPAAYFASPNLLPLVVFKMVNLSIKHGNSRDSSYGYVMYGLILCGVIGDLEGGYQFGRFAMDLVEKGDGQNRCNIILVMNNFIRFYKEHLKTTLDPLLAGYQYGLDAGEPEYVAYCALVYSFSSYYCGNELKKLEPEMDKYCQTLRLLQQEAPLRMHEVTYQMMLNLMGRSENPRRLNGKIFDEDVMLPELKKTKNQTAIAVAYISKTILCYLFSDYQGALENSKQAEKYVECVIGTLFNPLFYFYDALVKLALARGVSGSEKQKLLRATSTDMKKMKKWAHHAPMNFRHKYLLMEAELAGALGEDRAAGLYDQAIKLAVENGFVQEEGLACERAADFWLSKNKTDFAGLYLIKAKHNYKLWGAKAKVRDLQEVHAKLFSKLSEQEKPVVDRAASKKEEESSSSTTSSNLDLDTIMKAAQTISREIVLADLLKKMMNIMIENAGAQKGTLILKKNGQWLMEAAVSTEKQTMKILESIPIGSVESARDLPLSIVNYVSRTGENIILKDAAQDGKFAGDPYIENGKAKSILCLPVFHQGKPACILYMENNLATGAFTPERVKTLKMLSAQAIISLENARLYANLEQRVEERTLELRKALEDLHESQEKLVQSEKMASLGQLVAGVAHEINTPIGIGITAASNFDETTHEIMANLEGGKMKKSSLVTYLQNSKEAAQLILRNLLRTGELIQSFKLVSADQASKERRKFGLKTYLEDIIKSLQPELKNPHIEVGITCPEEIELNTYPGPLVQVVTNLVMNSKMHGFKDRKSGEIKIEADRAENGKVTIRYSDDGHGIDEETMPKIFDPFFTTNRSGGGTGLGLHIIFNIVTQTLMGEIRCESEPGQGATFIVVIPEEIV